MTDQSSRGGDFTNAFILDETINSRSDLGLRITAPPDIPSAKRDIDSISVDGREGTLTILKGWDDTTFKFKAAILGRNIPARWREVLPTILAAKTISFSNDAGVFYRVKYVRAGALDMKLSSLWECQLTFTCDPFRYLRSVAIITMTASESPFETALESSFGSFSESKSFVITNTGTVYSLPRITVYGTGTRTLTVNGKPIVLNILSSNLVIDSELKECHFGDVAQNNRMIGDFPEFQVGSNTIALGTGITKVEIEPRWRCL